jgi:Methyltransferase domain
MKNMMKFFLLALISNSLSASLIDYLPKTDKRFASFDMAKNLIKQRQLYTWVETGTSRNGSTNCIGDGCSTMVYSDFLTELDGELYSVDIDANAINCAKQALRKAKDRVHFFVSDSIAFLEYFDKPIDFLYLDSYDFDLNNPTPSQIHHLKEIEAAYDKLHDNSVVMIDDCRLPHGGKGKLIIDFLLQRGWKKVFDGYQVIMVKNV